MNRATPEFGLLQDALKQLAFTRVRRGRGDLDCLASRDRKTFAIEMKSVRPYRAADLRGQVAQGILQLRKHLQRGGARPLVAVLLHRLTPDALQELERFIEEFAPDFAWLALDSRGDRGWKIGKDQGRQISPRRRTPEPDRSIAFDPFSRRNQWALKVLLLSGIDPRHFGPSRQFDPPATVAELTRATGIASSQVWNLITTLRRLEYLAPVPEFRFRDCHRLLDDWTNAVRLKPDAVTFVRPLYSAERRADFYGRLAKATSREGRKLILGSFEGCRRLGLAKTNVEYLRVYSENTPSSLMRALDLAPATKQEAWAEIANPRDFSAVSSASVLVEDVRVTDVLQCYVDVRHYASRGLEQAEFLFDHVLRAHFRSRGWE